MLEIFYYVINTPYFWGAMGFTTATSMFIGSLIYGGELNQMKKSLYSVLSYSAVILWVNISRINERLSNTTSENIDYAMVYASTATVIVVTVFWLLGMFIGVIINKFIHHRSSKKEI